MSTGLKQRLSGARGPLLDRLLVWSAVLLVLAVVSFVLYYYLDQRGSGEEAGPIQHEIARFEEAVRANPEDIGARLGLAELYYASERYSESVEQYEAALTINEESALALVGLGRALLALGDQAAAISNFQQVIELAGEADISGELTEAAHYYLASVYLDQQRPGDAITHLKEALAIERTDADAWQLLGTAYLESGDVDEAIVAFSQAVSFVPNFAEAYEKLAIAYERKGLTAESHYARGMLAFSEGRYREAERELQAAHDAAPTLVDVYVGLGLVRESQGQHEQAIASYQQALELAPDNFNARAGLARLGAPVPEGTVEEEASP